MLFKISEFSGIVPKTAPDKLPAAGAEIATDCRLSSGSLEPWRGLLPVQRVRGLSSEIRRIFFYIAKGLLLTFTEDTDIVQSPIAQDQYGRLYFTDATNGARMAVQNDIVVDSLGRTQINYRPLGLSAPTAKATLSGSGGSSTLNVARALVYTFVSDIGEEGPPSPATDIVTMRYDDTVTVTGLQTTIPTGESIVSKRLYLTSVGTAGAAYQFWQEVDISVTTASGVIGGLTLQETLPSTYWSAAPSGLQGLTPLAGKFMAAFRGNEIWFSEPYYPHAWPPGYMLTVDANIVGLGFDGSTLVVLTDTRVYLVTADTPSTATVSPYPDIIPCVSKRSIVSSPLGVFFAGEDGLYLANSSGATRYTAKYFTKPQWEALDPKSMHAAYQNGILSVFHGLTSGMLFSLSEDDPGKISTLRLYATAAGPIAPADELGLAYPDGVDQVVGYFDADGYSTTNYTWRSRVAITPLPVNFSAMRVSSTGIGSGSSMALPPAPTGSPVCVGSGAVAEYPIADDWWAAHRVLRSTMDRRLTVRLFGDGILRDEFVIEDDSILSLSSGYRARRWQVEVEGNATVQSVWLATAASELALGPLFPGTSV